MKIHILLTAFFCSILLPLHSQTVRDTTANTVVAVKVSGYVIDERNEPVIGATVATVGKRASATLTDADGRFSLAVRNVPVRLKVSYVGFAPTTVDVPEDSISNMTIRLMPTAALLDEVVVVGYATQRKTDLTGAVSSINSAKLENRPVTNATNALAGLAAGLTVTNSGGNTPGFESQSITVRGLGTLNNAAPLVVVDGMTGIALSDINPPGKEIY